jgi:hypothetical protein
VSFYILDYAISGDMTFKITIINIVGFGQFSSLSIAIKKREISDSFIFNSAIGP